ncbi:MAG: hypothetical protein JWO07_467 [Candidatus Saccharibacteria bacterium]|nr:hypothetical protein [Candidatus Saccharibacteria bacterium]
MKSTGSNKKQRFILVLIFALSIQFSTLVVPTTHAVIGSCSTTNDNDIDNLWFAADVKITNPLEDVLSTHLFSEATVVQFTDKGLKSDLYIGSKDMDGKYPGYTTEQTNDRPLDSVIGHDYEPNVLISEGGTLAKGTYFFRGGWVRASQTIPLNTVLDSTDHYSPKQQSGLVARPAYVTAPAPDHQTMYAFYEGKMYNIDLDITYSLNPYYKAPQANNCNSAIVGDAFPTKAVNQPGPVNLFFLAIWALMLAIVFGGYRIYKSKKTSYKKNGQRTKPTNKNVRLVGTGKRTIGGKSSIKIPTPAAWLVLTISLIVLTLIMSANSDTFGPYIPKICFTNPGINSTVHSSSSTNLAIGVSASANIDSNCSMVVDWRQIFSTNSVIVVTLIVIAITMIGIFIKLSRLVEKKNK